MQEMLPHNLPADAGEEGKYTHLVRQGIIESGIPFTVADVPEIIVDVHADFCQVRVIFRVKGIKLAAFTLFRPVAPQQAPVKINTHLRHYRLAVHTGSSDLNAGDEVFTGIGTRNAYGELGTGENEGLVRVMDQEAQSRCRKSHGVGAVNDYKAVICMIMLFNNAGEGEVNIGIYVRRVDGFFKRNQVDLGGEVIELGQLLKRIMKAERHQRAFLFVKYHSQRTAGINDQDTGAVAGLNSDGVGHRSSSVSALKIE